MAVPGRFDLTLPILRKVSDGADWSTDRLMYALARDLEVSSEDLALVRSDGRREFMNNVGWARTWLRKAGLVEYPTPARTRVTSRGLGLVASGPTTLDREFFLTWGGTEAAGEAEHGLPAGQTLEDELRRLSGQAVRREREWRAVALVNGWGPEPPMPYRTVAAQTGMEAHELLSVGRACRRHRPDDAPFLDAALRLAIGRDALDPDDLSLDLAFAGLTRDAFSLPGLAEAARRFGRTPEWCALVGYLAAHRGRGRRPRPFESWFEVDVFLHLLETGHDVQPQRSIGRYRVDMLIPDLVPPLIVECDGDAFHTGDRAQEDEARERSLMKAGYRIMRLRYSDFRTRRESVERGLTETVESLARSGLQLRTG